MMTANDKRKETFIMFHLEFDRKKATDSAFMKEAEEWVKECEARGAEYDANEYEEAVRSGRIVVGPRDKDGKPIFDR